MTAKNDVTGDALRSKASNKKYDEGWDRIFGNKQREKKDNERKDNKQS